MTGVCLAKSKLEYRTKQTVSIRLCMCLRLSSSDYVKDESRDLFIGKRKEDDAVIVYLKEKAYNDQGYHTHYSNYQKEVNANRMKLVCSMMSLPLSFSSLSLTTLCLT